MHAPTFTLGRSIGLNVNRRRAIRHGILLASTVLTVGILLGIRDRWGTFGWDSFAYWNVDPADPYRAWYDRPGAFLYSPAAAQVMSVMHWLPWELFRVAWPVMLALVAARVAGWWVLLLPFVAFELFVGNIHVLLAAAIVIGFRFPAAWGFVLLTKMTCGIGLLWFAVRGEWRSLGIALGTTLMIVSISLLLAPGLWTDWARHLAEDPYRPGFGIPVPLALRLPAAALLVAWGARTNRRWVVPMAVWLALPTLWPSTSWTLLIAIVPLVRRPGILPFGGWRSVPALDRP